MQGAGRYAVLKDPQGAVFAIIDPENAKPEAAGAPPLGTFSWHELATSDNEAAFAFYSGLFGWDAIQRMDMGPAGVYLIFGENGVQRGGIYIKPAENPGPPSWLPYVHVPNADEGYAVALSKGAKGTVPPMDVPGGGRIANVIDPAGASFAVHSTGAVPKATPAAKPKAAAKAKAKPKAKAKTKAEGQAEEGCAGQEEGSGQKEGREASREGKERSEEIREGCIEEISGGEEEIGAAQEVEGSPEEEMTGRRDVIKAGLATLAATQALPAWSAEKSKEKKDKPKLPPSAPLMTKAVPSTGERLAAIGVGTNNYSPTTADERAARREVLAGLTAAGASVIDTAPAYRQSEEVDRRTAGRYRQPQAGLHRHQGDGA